MYLQKGDIIQLESGMTVYAYFPAKFRFSNTPFSNKPTHGDICIGRVLHKNVPKKSKLIEDLSKKISNALKIDIDVDLTKVEAFVDSLNLDFSPEEFDTSVFEGEYRVYHVESNGGGIDAHTSSLVPQHYPDGWHVYCEKVDNPEIRVDFYQDGCFTAVISDIKPIRNEN